MSDPLTRTHASVPTHGKLASAFDAIGAVLVRQQQMLLEGDADGLLRLSADLAGLIALAAEQRSTSISSAGLGQLQALSNQSRINMEMVRRREISVREAIEALTQNEGRFGVQRSSRVYAPAGTLSNSTSSGRTFASA